MQYRIDKTLVATKNRASLETSADIIPTGLLSIVLLQIVSPNLNGYSMLYTVGLFDPTDTWTSKLTVV